MTSPQSSSATCSCRCDNAQDKKQMANAIRALAMDAVQAANSGHPGMPMGAADIATVLYTKFMKFDPSAPTWADRDRFILSAGHGSMLLYALNYLTGYEKITLNEIKNFRQKDALTAGHPEVMPEAGIEITTGPLGQGISSAVGFALGERIMNGRFGDDLVDHYTYVICGDGDLMEGVSHEACSLAGHLKLGKLIVLYDDNGITIDGTTDVSFSENVAKRFDAYGWETLNADGHDFVSIEKAIETARKSDKPTIISCKTKIGFGAPNKENSSSAHGSPLGDEEIAGARKNLGWEYAPFDIPKNILDMWRSIGAQGALQRQNWENRLNDSAQKDKLLSALSGDVSEKTEQAIREAKTFFANEKPKMATRQTSGKVLEYLIPAIEEMIGGSADLTGSNNTRVKGYEDGIYPATDYKGRYIYYGVREHGMAAIMNGLALHGGIIPYSGTFLCFADYSRPSIRLGALMGVRTIHVLTHDSIGLGEDGPTHQPVEHAAALRAIPNSYFFRPCDGIETAESWEIALKTKDKPSMMALTRQGLPTLRENTPENLTAKGAYILSDCNDKPELTLFASGSEVYLAIEAKDKIISEGLATQIRVISVPCMELFFEQDGDYISKLLCNDSKKIAVEAAIDFGWQKMIGPHGGFVGMNGFGESAPANELFEHFGITVDGIIDTAKTMLEK